MKRILIGLCILGLCLNFAACSKTVGEKAPETTAETTAETTVQTAAEAGGVPNPVVEYGSLEEINEAAGVNLMRPAIMGVSEERFSVINNSIAQYVCSINGMEWTFRGASVTEEDISGIYDERNVFIPNEDSSLYANEFYLDRFFDGDRQYTIVVDYPVTEDGKILLDEETFSNCCMEMKSIQKQHMDDPLVGDYQNTADERMVLYVERHGDKYALSVNLSVSEREFKCWTMPDAEKDGNRLSYRGEEIGEYAYDEEWNETSSNVTASNNLGYFEIRDGMLYWTGAAEEECRTSVFEKIIYSEGPDDETGIAESSEAALPPYVYSGTDRAEKAIIDYFEDNNYLMKPEHYTTVKRTAGKEPSDHAAAKKPFTERGRSVCVPLPCGTKP